MEGCAFIKLFFIVMFQPRTEFIVIYEEYLQCLLEELPSVIMWGEPSAWALLRLLNTYFELVPVLLFRREVDPAIPQWDTLVSTELCSQRLLY